MVAKYIFLVEDDPDDETLTLRALAKGPHAVPVVVVRDGAEALDYLLRRGGHADRPAAQQPAVVLLDLNLPKLGGLDVLRALRLDPSTRLLPVVILTASLEERDLAESYRIGANGYVRKPVDYKAFEQAARDLSAYWVGLNELPPVAGA